MRVFNWSGVLLAVMTCIAAERAGAQLATLVGDPRTFDDSFGSSGGSNPRDFVDFEGRAVFFASHGLLGSRPWVSDGTPEGTELLGDTCPGCPVAAPIAPLARSSRFYYFLQGIEEFGGGSQLWRTDGTRAGTIHLADFTAFSGPKAVVATEDSSFFFASTPATGNELWRSDGTPAGTRLVRELAPGGDSVSAQALRPFGSGVAFLISRQSGIELWASDGTQGGTRLVRELPSSAPVFNNDSLVTVGTRLLFLAREAFTGRRELWASDGSTAGTVRLLLGSQPNDFSSAEILALGDRAFFPWTTPEEGNELWSSDGTAAGTLAITELASEFPFFSDLGRRLARLDNRLLFIARPGGDTIELLAADVDRLGVVPVSVIEPDECFSPVGFQLVRLRDRVLFDACAGSRTELRSTDGSAAGTVVLRASLSDDYTGVHPVPGDDGAVYFLDRGPNGLEIFSTDGTPAGLRRWTEFPSALFTETFPPFLRQAMCRLGDRILFSARDTEQRGFELWSAGATPASTRLVADLDPDGRHSLAYDVVEAAGGAFFLTPAGDDPARLWRTAGESFDATAAFELEEPGCVSFDDARLVRRGELTFLLCQNELLGRVVHRTDGTAEGTVPLFQFPWSARQNENTVELGDFVYFAAANNSGVIWRTDGTAAGSEQVVSELDLASLRTDSLTRLGDHLYFLGFGSDTRLFRSDGTRQGTSSLATLASTPASLVPLGNRLVFLLGGDFEAAVSLWGTDGTAGGTGLLVDLHELGITGLLREHGGTALGNELYFFSTDPFSSRGQDLWKTDGTLAGTQRVKTNVDDGQGFSVFTRPVVLGNALYFVARTGENGTELWKTDGTEAGTRLVRDIAPGLGSSDPHGLTVAGDRLFFGARSRTVGVELWVSDGTVEGTRLVHDVAPGPLSSIPTDLREIGNRLYFSANDGLHGRELWSLNLDETGCVPNDHALCLQDGRFRVEADWKDFQGNAGRGNAISLTPDTGYFWFFSPTNVEAVLKVLDGRGLNDHFWTFYGALSTVEYNLTITDAQTGVSRRYYNPPGHLASRADTASFGPDGASLERYTPPADEPPSIQEIFRFESSAQRGSCAPASNRLCLRNGRFAVEASWRDFQGNTGTGTAIEITGDTGAFWFFRPENLEVILKLLDGTGLNGKHWVFYGALSSVEYTLTVTDTQTGAVKTYFNPLGRLASVADTGAF